MLKSRRRHFLATIASLCGSLALPATARAQGLVGANRQYRIALLQDSVSPVDSFYLRAIASHLMNLNWLESREFDTEGDATLVSDWNWLSELRSPHLKFLPDPLFISACDDRADPAGANQNSTPLSQLNDYVNSKGHLDLVLAFGIDSEKGLEDLQLPVPMLAIGVDDHIADYLKNNTKAYELENFYLHRRPQNLLRNLSLFNDVVHFSKVGVVHHALSDSLETATAEMSATVASQLGALVEHSFVDKSASCVDQEKKYLSHCNRMIRTVDALYLKPHPGLTSRTVPELVSMSRRADVPICCEGNEKFVRQGILMCTTSMNRNQQSIDKIARNIQSVLQRKIGHKEIAERPGEYQFHLNMMTAENIGVYLSADILAAADQIYVDMSVE